MSSTQLTDEGVLESFGYKQELKRSLSFWTNFAVGFAFISPVVGLYAIISLATFAAADGAADEGQLALQERLAGRSGPTAPVACAYARGLYDGVRAAVRSVGGRRASGRPVSTPRLAHADGLHFREVTLPRSA
jgi:hypothetical protein